jgi:hypothetical protein
MREMLDLGYGRADFLMECSGRFGVVARRANDLRPRGKDEKREKLGEEWREKREDRNTQFCVAEKAGKVDGERYATRAGQTREIL